MFGKNRDKNVYSVTFSFEKSAMTNLYNFAKIRFCDGYFTVDWASGTLCKITFADVKSAKIVHHGMNTWIEVSTAQNSVYISSSKNREVLQKILALCENISD